MAPSASYHWPASSPERLRLERDRHVAFAFAAADLLIETAIDGAIVAASGAAQAVLGVAVRALPGRALAELVVPGDRGLVRRLLQQVHQVGRIDPVTTHLIRPDGVTSRVLLGACCLPNGGDQVFLSASLLPTTLTAAVQARDAATGLLSPEALREAAQRGCTEDGGGKRELKLLHLQGLSGAVRQLPADRSAMLLQEIGAALRAVSVGGDAAGRLGEDTFGLVARSGHRDAALVAELRDVFRDAGLAEGQIGPRLARVDLALGGLSGGEAGQALSYAMNSFVAAQGSAFNIGSLREGLAAAVDATVNRFAETRQIISELRFSLVFQPVVALAGRAVHHYEVLSRFHGKPNTFEMVGFMEDVGLVSELDLAVCRMTLAALEQNPGVRLAINLSGRSVQSEAFRNQLSALISGVALLGDRLMFELTESAAVERLEEAASFLGWLRQRGHQVCLDDFGSGAAAYSYLRRFDVDYLKIDGPFLKAAQEMGRERALIRSICVLCDEIGAKVIGEMIEDEKAAALAKSLGIGYGQGWLFGKPMRELPKPVTASRRKGAVETWE
ncbi:MAG TPA: EAL domain-containing protein [Acetobacteraceae bacterium]|nr:EAL domain-containing protein [Acetobacteraceae bacterium]